MNNANNSKNKSKNAEFTPGVCRGRIQYGDFEHGGSFRTDGKGNYVKETIYQDRGIYYLRIERGRQTPAWKFWGEKSRNWTVTYKSLSDSEAKSWIDQHLGVDDPVAIAAIFGD